jgi:L-fuconolactonase
MRIDAHQHYWNPARGDYSWMPADHKVLTRAYFPGDLEPMLLDVRIERTVLVQAAPSIEETEYMLGMADVTPSIAGVVGWADFESRDDLRQLERLKRHPKFVGVRPMIQDIADVDWMLRKDVQWAFAALVDLDLTFDALGFSRHLKNFLTVLSRYPTLRAVVDHSMKPQVRDKGTERDEFTFWAAGMSRIASETGAYCKLSGLVTETDGGWTLETLRPYGGHVLSAFGAERVMWGSDWPVCLLQSSYADWLSATEGLCAGLSEPDKAQVFGGSAARFYQLTP